MCGIIAAISKRNVTSILISGLHQMEYRGYDSAGLCIYNDDHQVETKKVEGRVKKLEDKIAQEPISGRIGIAHTRWATHGAPSEDNAHPIVSNNEFAVVHNGIIENHAELKAELIKKNYQFVSDTDTEVIAHLLHDKYQKYKADNNIFKAVQDTIELLKGSYAIAVLTPHQPDKIFAVRQGSPLIIGVGIEENFVASDQLALLPVTSNFIFLDESEIAVLEVNSLTVYDKKGLPIDKPITKSTAAANSIELGSHRHYMYKEIVEQPIILSDTLMGNIHNNAVLDSTFGLKSTEIFNKLKSIQFVACGSSYHAALVAKYWIEKWVGIPCVVSIASEFRMQRPIVLDNMLLVTISQSGETADTLAAVRLAKDFHYLAILAICNVPHSSLAREADLVMHTRAGAEIGVASTKAFLTQLLGLLMLNVCLSRRVSNQFVNFNEQEISQAIQTLPRLIADTLKLEEQIKTLAGFFVEKHHALFLGRGPVYPIAMEGALKLKEISYIHAESYPAGELKHGPLALVDDKMPVIALVSNDEYHEKMLSNLQEVKSRSGDIFVFAQDGSTADYSKISKHVCYLPACHELLMPLIYTIPMQLLSYHIAVLRGTDIDKPRNLAKSVTVE